MKNYPSLINAVAIAILSYTLFGVVKMSDKIPCPNCLEPAEKIGNKIICQACDSTFVITKTGGAKVKEIGWKEKIEERLGILEVGLVGDGEPAAEAEVEAESKAEEPEPFLPE